MGGFGSYGYPAHMMGGGGHPHMGGHGGNHGMHHMGGHGGGRGGGGGGGLVPFRAGDWKCGHEGCSYHNFAKNVSCLRCGAPRSQAAVMPEMSNFGASSMGGGMETPSSSTYGMHQHSSMSGGTPGGGASTYGPGPGGYGSGGGYHGHQYGGPPSTYALPSGLAGGAGYPPMGAYGTNPNNNNNNNGNTISGAMDNLNAYGGNVGGQTPASSVGASGAQNGGGNFGYDGGAAGGDPFSFLSTGLGGLSMDDGGNNGRGRNGAAGQGAGVAKSPA